MIKCCKNNLFVFAGLYGQYVEEMKFFDVDTVSENHFYKLWRDELSHITIPEVSYYRYRNNCLHCLHSLAKEIHLSVVVRVTF